MNGELDIAANRDAVKYPLRIQLYRVLWGIAFPLFRCSPRPMFCWRVFLLRLFGARIGRNVRLYSSVSVAMPWNLEIGDWSSVGEEAYIYNLGRVTIGEKTTISHRAHLCAGTHDHRRADLPLLKPPIQIGNSVWICADAFVGPGVVVGDGAIVGARAVAVHRVEPWTIVAGNPARVVGKREISA